MTNVLFAQDYKEGSKVPTVSNPPFNVEDYQEQTEMKHKVLRDYLDKWVKILGVGFTGRLNYIDGFAGLGAYSKNGEIHYGSPVIAAEVIKNNRRFVNHSTLTLIDADNLVLENLQKVLNYKGFYNCEEMEVRFINKDFNKAINEDILKKVEGNLSPTFAFIDPFGFEGIHFETIKNIMEQTSTPEIVINFMYNSINRFLKRPDLTDTFTRMFGTSEWQTVLQQSGNREENIVNYYVSRLKKISKFVIPYRLDFPNKRRTYYYLIHLTNHYLGASIMKSSFGKFSPSGLQWLGNSAQTSLADILNIDSKLIKDLLVSKYNKQSVSFKQIMIDNIDTTPYNESQFREALKELETENVVYIERFPKIGESGRPLTAIDVKSDQIIHFNCFPSIERKSLLYETKVEYGNFTINHAFGCAHGCKYPCYAFLMARSYGKAKNYEEWIHPKIVSNAMELLEKEIPKYKDKIDFVHLSFTTDPFMYNPTSGQVFPAIKELTLKIVKKLNAESLKATVLTKGLYPQELADDGEFRKDNEYGITLVSLSEKFRKEFEPFAAPFEDRIKALEFLHNKGLKTWVSMEPYPTPNLVKQDIEKVLARVAFADKIIFGKMNYNPEATKFPNAEIFYKECSQKVIDFCLKLRKQYHIKKGTPNADVSTKELFKNGEC